MGLNWLLKEPSLGGCRILDLQDALQRHGLGDLMYKDLMHAGNAARRNMLVCAYGCMRERESEIASFWEGENLVSIPSPREDFSFPVESSCLSVPQAYYIIYFDWTRNSFYYTFI